MGDPISFLIYLVVLGLVLWLLFWILSQVAMPQPIRMIIIVVVALVVLVWLLRQSGLLSL